jgi:hypothetical protein
LWFLCCYLSNALFLSKSTLILVLLLYLWIVDSNLQLHQQPSCHCYFVQLVSFYILHPMITIINNQQESSSSTTQRLWVVTGTNGLIPFYRRLDDVDMDSLVDSVSFLLGWIVVWNDAFQHSVEFLLFRRQIKHKQQQQQSSYRHSNYLLQTNALSDQYMENDLVAIQQSTVVDNNNNDNNKQISRLCVITSTNGVILLCRWQDDVDTDLFADPHIAFTDPFCIDSSEGGIRRQYKTIIIVE